MKGWWRGRGCAAPRQTGGGVGKRGTAARRTAQGRDKVRDKSAKERATHADGNTDDPTTMLTATGKMINVTASVPRANVTDP
jgi:hypothetical protein